MKNIHNICARALLSAAFLLIIGMNASLAYQGTNQKLERKPYNGNPHNTDSQNNYSHCTLSGTTPCAGANESRKSITEIQRSSAVNPTWSARAGLGLARVAVDLDNVCRWVDRSPDNAESKELFVPFKSNTEWHAFVNNAPAKVVSLAACARPSVIIPPNDPAGNHENMVCYNQSGGVETLGRHYTNFAYGRVGENRTFKPANLAFSCYTLDQKGPFPKTVESITIVGHSADRTDNTGKKIGTSGNPANADWTVLSAKYSTPTAVCGAANGASLSAAPSGAQLCNYGAASAVGGSGPWTWTCRGLKNTASCTAYKPIAGTCGSANGKSLTTAPTATELCSTGTASGVSGSGPWTWTCSGLYGGIGASCSAQKTPPTCPPLSVFGPCHPIIGCLAQPLNNGYMDMNIAGFGHHVARHTGGRTWNSAQSEWEYHVWGSCNWANYLGQPKEPFFNCIATQYVKNNLPGYSNMTGTCAVNPSQYLSPLKVNLTEGNAAINSTQPTTFYLTLLDGRIMEGKATGGLNPNEGWLMVRRTNAPLVFNNGALNADNWFGDRDRRTVNGFTDLAETFSSFIETDENGQRFIPLNILTEDERKAKAARAAATPGQITDPSFDLRVVDAQNIERLASDFFSRIYVDYRPVVEGDGKDGNLNDSNNVVLERGTVRTINGKQTEILDQWFIIDLPGDMSPAKGPTKSRILPANN